MSTIPPPAADTGARSLRFLSGETLSEGLSRVNEEQFTIALAIVDAAPADRAAAVHETRKAIKRLRAMLRLVRDSISADSYHSDNAMLKLIAAELAAVRDSWVMAEVLDRLLPSDSATPGIGDVLMERLQERYRSDSAALLENEAQMAAIVEQLEQVREHADRWTLVPGELETPLPHEFGQIAPGLQRVYKRGRRGMRIVAGSPTDTLLHVWRKRAKYLRHQVEALNVLDPPGLGPLELDLERLTDLLGDDHDLAVLLARLSNDPGLTEDVDLAEVLAAVGRKRHDLQAEAIELGKRIFADPSTDFLAYVKRIWGTGDTF